MIAMTDDQPRLVSHVQALVERSGSSFFWGMRILPLPHRNAMYAIYAFCRVVDDIADEGGTRSDKLKQLDAWRKEIDQLYEGRPENPVARALLAPVTEFSLPRDDFLAIIDGMEMDARETMRAPDLATLELYCHRVAGVVGLLSVRVFGAHGPEARHLALSLGSALQLTNILRDLEEDARLDRLYLPRELLYAHGVASDDPSEVLRHPDLGSVCANVAAMARHHFDQATSALATCPRRPLRPAIVMMTIYRRLLDRLLRRGWVRLDQPVSLGTAEKVWIAIRHGVF